MTDIKHQIALHNCAVELEALRAEGRGMVWENEQRLNRGATVAYCDDAFNALAARIRECKVKVDDAVLLEGIR
ncbi:MAG TPA: hypothetical protein VGD45_20325 [Steroidobacter sp.]|uniref:hypothetical protein n=1 Tax=Steroidobacter sp. TaxID=1978227 RepID=UPI002ED7FEE2